MQHVRQHQTGDLFWKTKSSKMVNHSFLVLKKHAFLFVFKQGSKTKNKDINLNHEKCLGQHETNYKYKKKLCKNSTKNDKQV